MSRARLVDRGRAAAEAGMVDACTIRRPVTGLAVTDPVTGVVVKGYAPADPYSGKCRVQQLLARVDQHDVGEDYVTMLRLVLQLPVSVVGVQVNDEVTITVSQDPDLVGRVFLIWDLFHKTDSTSRRIGVKERTNS